MVKMDGNRRGCDTPRVVDAKKPFDNPHKIHFAAFTEEVAKQGFDGGIFRKVDQVIHMKPQRERMFGGIFGWVFGISDETGVKAMWKRLGEFVCEIKVRFTIVILLTKNKRAVVLHRRSR